VVLEDPWNPEGSEFTWLSDGSSNYTTTMGNNAYAQQNKDGDSSYQNDYRPESESLAFEYEYDVSMTPPESYRDASVAQLFYSGT
jgi:extracellular elastinolytic metalloproteinase